MLILRTQCKCLVKVEKALNLYNKDEGQKQLCLDHRYKRGLAGQLDIWSPQEQVYRHRDTQRDKRLCHEAQEQEWGEPQIILDRIIRKFLGEQAASLPPSLSPSLPVPNSQGKALTGPALVKCQPTQPQPCTHYLDRGQETTSQTCLLGGT